MAFFGKKIPLGFSSSSTAEEVTQGIDGTGLTAIVTGEGATSGIGLETARVLALHGVQVVVGARNVAAAADVKKEIIKKIPDAKLDILELDLGSMASVRKFVSDFDSLGLPLNILMYRYYLAYGQSKLANILHSNELSRRLKVILNVNEEQGAPLTANSLTPGPVYTNIFKHNHCLDVIFAGAASGIGAETALVLALRGVHVVIGDLDLAAAMDVKAAIIKKVPDAKVDLLELDLGSMASIRKFVHEFNSLGLPLNILIYSGFGAYGQSKLLVILHSNELARHLKGAATTCYVALHPQVKGASGQFFRNCDIAETSSQGLDEKLAKKLWDYSMSLIH
ncbi:hypothetical protein Sjap_020912 [Stephania japonica]|uniref:Uncharacterized protein n=1 Tax=Stephania japonica TaxID=461633 RepID=A0AAP0F8X7_9MAGN